MLSRSGPRWRSEVWVQGQLHPDLNWFCCIYLFKVRLHLIAVLIADNIPAPALKWRCGFSIKYFAFRQITSVARCLRHDEGRLHAPATEYIYDLLFFIFSGLFFNWVWNGITRAGFITYRELSFFLPPAAGTKPTAAVRSSGFCGPDWYISVRSPIFSVCIWGVRPAFRVTQLAAEILR